MSWPTVAIGDVKDAYGFVSRCIGKSGIKTFSAQEYDELMCEGIVILCALHERYDPRKDKGTAPVRGVKSTKGVASFAGYASYLLPRKLRDAWHRMHPEHVLKTMPDKTRKYVYYEPPKSLDEMRSSTGVQDSGDRVGHVGGGELDERNLRLPGDFATIPLPS